MKTQKYFQIITFVTFYLENTLIAKVSLKLFCINIYRYNIERRDKLQNYDLAYFGISSQFQTPKIFNTELNDFEK